MYTFGIAVLLELSLGEVIANVPHDTSAIVVFALLLGFIYFVWYGSRQSMIDKYAQRSGSGMADRNDGDERDGRKAEA